MICFLTLYVRIFVMPVLSISDIILPFHPGGVDVMCSSS